MASFFITDFYRAWRRFAVTGAGHHASMTEWEIIDALTDGDVSRFGFTYREAYEWLQERRDAAMRNVHGFRSSSSSDIPIFF